MLPNAVVCAVRGRGGGAVRAAAFYDSSAAADSITALVLVLVLVVESVETVAVPAVRVVVEVVLAIAYSDGLLAKLLRPFDVLRVIRWRWRRWRQLPA